MSLFGGLFKSGAEKQAERDSADARLKLQDVGAERDENPDVVRRLNSIEARKERGKRMCEKLIELLHVATSKAE